MPLFYFDTQDGSEITRDEQGMNLLNAEAARLEAIDALPDIARETIPGDGNRRDLIVDVRDDEDRIIFTAQLTFTARWIP